ncbi:MAG TPA: isoprenyl transferase [Blastocatellia bacterium]|nr:isoprenyl transferase [Blastocatellia bacterium]
MAMRRIDLAKTGDKLDEALLSRLDAARMPAHVAVIMDGNGRWAAQRKLPRIAGHRAGADAVRRTVETAARWGLECLTLYAFSTENWKRPRLEVRALMDLLMEFLRKELKTLRDNNIRFRLIGRGDGLHISVLEQIRRAELATMQNTGLQLNIAVNYGGRAELVDACRRVAEEVAAGRLRPEEINEQVIEAQLYTHMLPDPDLLIRTSGETRISNFLLWQIAYAEIYITDTLWPDFSERDFLSALIEYQKRDRRFGGVREAKPGLTLEWAAGERLAPTGD